MSEIYNLKSQLNRLGDLDGHSDSNTGTLKRKIKALKEITLGLVEEIENLEISQPISVRRGINLRKEVQDFEARIIKSALKQTGGHQTRAARLLGIRITTLNAKIKRLGISPDLKFGASNYQKNSNFFELREEV